MHVHVPSQGRVSPAWESISAPRHIFLILANAFHSVTAFEVRVKPTVLALRPLYTRLLMLIVSASCQLPMLWAWFISDAARLSCAASSVCTNRRGVWRPSLVCTECARIHGECRFSHRQLARWQGAQMMCSSCSNEMPSNFPAYASLHVQA